MQCSSYEALHHATNRKWAFVFAVRSEWPAKPDEELVCSNGASVGALGTSGRIVPLRGISLDDDGKLVLRPYTFL